MPDLNYGSLNFRGSFHIGWFEFNLVDLRRIIPKWASLVFHAWIDAAIHDRLDYLVAHRLPEEVCEGHAAHHDVLLVELHQRLIRHKTADGIEAPEDVQDDPRGPRCLSIIRAGGLAPPPEKEPFIAGLLEGVFLLDRLGVTLPNLGQPAFDIVVYLSLGYAELVGNGLLGRPGLLQLQDLGAS